MVKSFSRFILKLFSILILASLMLSSAGSAAAGAPPQDPPPSVKAPWAECFAEGMQLRRHAQTGALRFAGASREVPIRLPDEGLRASAPEEAARGYLSRCGSFFGLDARAGGLSLMRSKQVEDGRSVVRFQQTHAGIPVFAGELVVQLTSGNDVLLVAGELLPDISARTEPVISPEQARAAAFSAASGSITSDTGALQVTEPQLWLYNPALVENRQGPTSLVWRMEVTGDVAAPLRYLVLIHAIDGSVVLSINQADTARNRLTYTADNGLTRPGRLLCNESDPTCTGAGTDSHAKNAHDFAGDTYDFYMAHHSRDSIDGLGMSLISTVHYDLNWCNASWNGTQMTYGDGCFITVDDVVGHELTHGVTQHESNLVYAYQSGAINESFSDIWGEFVDLTNGAGNDDSAVRWLNAEDSDEGPFRDMQDPTAYGDPDRMGSTLYYNGTSDNGGVHTNSGVGNKAAYLITDGDTFNGKTVTGLGITKTAKIYYEVQTNILTSGSNYEALGDGLYQACDTLVGSYEITLADCQEVAEATAATEMNGPVVAENDDFDSPRAISAVPYTSPSLDTSAATTATDDPNLTCAMSGGQGSHSVWFRYTATTNSELIFDTLESDYDTVLAIWTGERGSLALEACSDDSGDGLKSLAHLTTTAGTVYHIEVAGWGAGFGNLVLRGYFAPPGNDDFDSAVVVGSLPYSSPTINTSGASTATDDPSLACYDVQHFKTVWYDFTATENTTLTVDTQGSSYDTVMAVWTGSRGSLVSQGCNDDFAGLASQVEFFATAGTTYHIEVASYGDEGGNLVLHVAGYEATDWVGRLEMIVPRSRPSAAAVNGHVYVISGESPNPGAARAKPAAESEMTEGVAGAIWETVVEAYDPSSDSWAERAAKPTGVSNTGAGVINNQIYVPGGWTGTLLSAALEVYDPASNSWSTKASMPAAQYGHAVAAIGHKLYVMGGWNDLSLLDTCRVYDADTNLWSTCGTMNYAREFAGAGVVNGKIYVVGGLDSVGLEMASVEEFTPPSTWTVKADMSTARGGPGVVGYGNTLYVCGGGFYDYLDTCEQYSPTSNSWSSLDHLNHGRRTLGMAALNGRLYAEAGWAGEYLALNEELQLETTCYTLTKGASLGSGGTVNASPGPDCNGGTQYTPGTSVTLTAGAVAGYVFTGWSGDASGGTNPLSITMDSDKSLVANYQSGSTSPTILTLYPANGSTACRRPPIGVTLLLSWGVRTSSGAFDPAKVALLLDGGAVTSLATISQTESSPASHATILYTPPSNLGTGSHQVKFQYPSPTGTQTLTWNFTAAAIGCTSSSAASVDVGSSSAQAPLEIQEPAPMVEATAIGPMAIDPISVATWLSIPPTNVREPRLRFRR